MFLVPLSEAEKSVAHQNYWLVKRFLELRKLPEDEWFDVVVFRYLLTVERWFRQPELYKYEFSTIAWNAMRSAVANERKKQRRQIKTVSLDEFIPGTDGLTWGDVVTKEHLDYTPYLMEDANEDCIQLGISPREKKAWRKYE